MGTVGRYRRGRSSGPDRLLPQGALVRCPSPLGDERLAVAAGLLLELGPCVRGPVRVTVFHTQPRHEESSAALASRPVQVVVGVPPGHGLVVPETRLTADHVGVPRDPLVERYRFGDLVEYALAAPELVGVREDSVRRTHRRGQL